MAGAKSWIAQRKVTNTSLSADPVPKGLRELAFEISLTVLRGHPVNICGFIADYLQDLLATRDNSNTLEQFIVKDLLENELTYEAMLERWGVSLPIANHAATIIQSSYRGYLSRKNYLVSRIRESAALSSTELFDREDTDIEEVTNAAILIQRHIRLMIGNGVQEKPPGEPQNQRRRRFNSPVNNVLVNEPSPAPAELTPAVVSTADEPRVTMETQTVVSLNRSGVNPPQDSLLEVATPETEETAAEPRASGTETQTLDKGSKHSASSRLALTTSEGAAHADSPPVITKEDLGNVSSTMLDLPVSLRSISGVLSRVEASRATCTPSPPETGKKQGNLTEKRSCLISGLVAGKDTSLPSLVSPSKTEKDQGLLREKTILNSPPMSSVCSEHPDLIPQERAVSIKQALPNSNSDCSYEIETKRTNYCSSRFTEDDNESVFRTLPYSITEILRAIDTHINTLKSLSSPSEKEKKSVTKIQHSLNSEIMSEKYIKNSSSTPSSRVAKAKGEIIKMGQPSSNTEMFSEADLTNSSPTPPPTMTNEKSEIIEKAKPSSNLDLSNNAETNQTLLNSSPSMTKEEAEDGTGPKVQSSLSSGCSNLDFMCESVQMTEQTVTVAEAMKHLELPRVLDDETSRDFERIQFQTSYTSTISDCLDRHSSLMSHGTTSMKDDSLVNLCKYESATPAEAIHSNISFSSDADYFQDRATTSESNYLGISKSYTLMSSLTRFEPESAVSSPEASSSKLLEYTLRYSQTNITLHEAEVIFNDVSSEQCHVNTSDAPTVHVEPSNTALESFEDFRSFVEELIMMIVGDRQEATAAKDEAKSISATQPADASSAAKPERVAVDGREHFQVFEREDNGQRGITRGESSCSIGSGGSVQFTSATIVEPPYLAPVSADSEVFYQALECHLPLDTSSNSIQTRTGSAIGTIVPNSDVDIVQLADDVENGKDVDNLDSDGSFNTNSRGRTEAKESDVMLMVDNCTYHTHMDDFHNI